MILLPELGATAVDRQIELARTDVESATLRSKRSRGLPLDATFAATGGSRASWAQLSEIREAADEIANDCGYPNRPLSARFDAKMSVLLASHQLFKSGASQKDSVWAYVATSLLFHLTVWRFSIDSHARFHGGIRNTFQRLWIRGKLLDRGSDSSKDSRWALLNILTEDALVAISERPAISAHSSLALAIAEGWTRCACEIGGKNMEPVMRRAIVKIRLQNEIQALSVLPAETLAEIIDMTFNKSLESPIKK